MNLTRSEKAPAGAFLHSSAGVLIAAVVVGAVFFWAYRLGDSGSQGRALAFSLLSGAFFGLILQRSRFCFLCITRDFFDRRDARGLLGLVAALAIGTLGYHAVFGAFLPIPGPGRLPAGAHIGPVSWVLAVGAFVFGIGMAVSGSCISAHLYRLGEGASGSPFALLGAALGFVLGFLSWNTLYLGAIQEAPVAWLPHYVGYGGSLLIQLGVLGAIAWGLWRVHRSDHQALEGERGTLRALLFGQRWPAYVGGILVGALGVIAYFRSAPLGVTAELGSIARTGAQKVSLLPSRLEGLDTFAGCATVIKEALFSPNGIFITGLVLAAWASALVAGDFRLRRLTWADLGRNLLGGVLMGWGAMVSLGCTVGVLLSGVMAGAASGWVFGVFCFGGVWLGLQVRRRLG